jgi:hypothetical protein
MRQSRPKHLSIVGDALKWMALVVVLCNAVAFGFANGAMEHVSPSGVMSVLCGSSDDAAPSQGPEKPHCVSCAILHASSAIENDVAPRQTAIVVQVPPPVLQFPVFKCGAIISAPELRPLCSRAPPAQNA